MCNSIEYLKKIIELFAFHHKEIKMQFQQGNLMFINDSFIIIQEIYVLIDHSSAVLLTYWLAIMRKNKQIHSYFPFSKR